MNPLNLSCDRWRTRALVDIKALNHNVSLIRQFAQHSKIMAVIKANAYGHGVEHVYLALKDKVHGFAVATIEEAIKCRELDASTCVTVLSEFWQFHHLNLFSHYNLQFVLHNDRQIEFLKNHTGASLGVWLKIDSEMNRLGFDLARADKIFHDLCDLPMISEVNVMTHFSNADDLADGKTGRQINDFLRATDAFDTQLSLANSAAIMGWPMSHKDWVRPGLALYGITPFCAPSMLANELQSVMTLQARVISMKQVAANQPIGYAGKFVTNRITRIAIVGFGYGDGYPRNLSEEAYILINGCKAPILGRVSMDMMTLDVTDIEEVSLGDIATLWGETLSVAKVAEWAQTIPYELLCKVTARTQRIAINS